MFRACLTVVGTYAAGFISGQFAKDFLVGNTLPDSNKTVSATDKIGKQILVDTKEVQASEPKPMDPSKVQALKDKYTFDGTRYPSGVRSAEDIKAGNFVECLADNNAYSKFQGDWKITGLKDPVACEAVRQVVLEKIAMSQDNLNEALEQLYKFKSVPCLPLISNLEFQFKNLKQRADTVDAVWKDERLNNALEALYSYEQPSPHPDIQAVYEAHRQLKWSKLPLNNDIVFRAIPKDKGRRCY